MSDPRDPMRALDGHERPPTWEDIVARVEEPVVDAGPERRRFGRRGQALAVAAILVVVAGLAALVATAQQDRGHEAITATSVPTDPTSPEAIWGRVWQVSRIVRHGERQPVIVADAPIRIDTSQRGVVRFDGGCNQLTGAATVEEATFVHHGLWGRTTTPCGDDHGRLPEVAAQDRLLLARQTNWVERLLGSRPTITISRDALVLSGPRGDRIELVDAGTFEDPAAILHTTWRITRFEVGGTPQPLRRELNGRRPFIRFATSTMAISVHCNGLTGSVAISGEFLKQTSDWISTGETCAGDISGLAGELLRQDPVIQVRADRLVLQRGEDRIDAVQVDPDDLDAGAVTTTTIAPTTTTTP